MDIIYGILSESYQLLNQMAPYLLFGFLFAGILHIFLDTETVARHLGKNSFFSVIKAALFGIPLPLCSCGVIPAALSLRKEGASKGAVLSFLIATPTTGVDSILATYSLMGGIFAVFRIIASFIAAVFSGILANIFAGKDDPKETEKKNVCKLCDEDKDHSHPTSHRIKGIFTYAFGDLLSDIGGWLIIGILIGGGIAYFLPEEFIHTYLGDGWQAMAIMLVIGIPMYVCATGSIPIAAALMLKGLNPGAAFVFLLAGPATNAVTITLVSKNLGKKAAVIYLLSIAVCSIGMGLILDRIWGLFKTSDIGPMMAHGTMIPGWIETIASIVLLGLIGFHFIRKTRKHSPWPVA